MNRPRQVLMQALMEDAKPLVDELRRKGWPVEAVAVSESGFYGLRFQVDLGALPVPVETE